MTHMLREALQQSIAQLRHSDSPDLDAQLLLAHVLGKSRTWLYTWPIHVLSWEQQQQFAELVQRRASGEPVAYLTGRRAFWTTTLQVGPDVLIPRPETELLVELALQYGRGAAGPVVDLGTGSGAIALALAGERADWQVHATELSEGACSVAATNISASHCSNLTLFAGSWFDPLPAETRYSLAVSNPPYVDAADPHLEQGDLRFEPRRALVAADAGMADLTVIARQARARLQPAGWLLLEHGWQQGAAVRDLLGGLGYEAVETRQDMGGRDRVTLGRWNGMA